MRPNRLTEEIIGAAIEVHRYLGPGMLESVYEACLCHELSLRRIPYERQLALPLLYKGMRLDRDYRVDLVVDNTVVVEIKAVEAFVPAHDAQLLSYMRLGGWPLGLLFNFHVAQLSDGGFRHKVYRFQE
jgi:GxxExxY protein